MITKVAVSGSRCRPIGPETSAGRRARSTRPTVAMPQHALRASRACVTEAPSSLVMSGWAQLPLTVSQIPEDRRLSPRRVGTLCVDDLRIGGVQQRRRWEDGTWRLPARPLRRPMTCRLPSRSSGRVRLGRSWFRVGSAESPALGTADRAVPADTGRASGVLCDDCGSGLRRGHRTADCGPHRRGSPLALIAK